MKVRKKSKPAEQFLDGLIAHIETNVLRKKLLAGYSEREVCGQVYQMVGDYLKLHFRDTHKDFEKKARDSFYWECDDDGNKQQPKVTVFGAKHYPDIIIFEPYRIAIEYKKSKTGAMVKQCLGQAMMYMASGNYDFAYILFDDLSKGKVIQQSLNGAREQEVRALMWKEFNTKIQVL